MLDMEITTSLVTYCSYYDWCGVCEGNGMSCCSQQLIDQYCNDNDACTTDTCGVQVLFICICTGKDFNNVISPFRYLLLITDVYIPEGIVLPPRNVLTLTATLLLVTVWYVLFTFYFRSILPVC